MEINLRVDVYVHLDSQTQELAKLVQQLRSSNDALEQSVRQAGGTAAEPIPVNPLEKPK